MPYNRLQLNMTAVITFLFVIVITLSNCQEERGNPCVLLNGQKGICELFNKCPSAVIAASGPEKEKVCGFEGKTPIVCCERADGNSNVSKSNAFCNEMYKSLPPMSSSVSLIETQATARRFPHMAALGFGESKDIQWLCAGSLISNTFVLTAAHCLSNREYGNITFVRLGDSDLKLDTDDAAPQTLGVKRLIQHPSFKPSRAYHDIALIELEKPAVFTDHVRPICLHTSSSLTERSVFATSWGEPFHQPDHLQKLTLRLLANEACREFYETSRKMPNGVEDDKQICASGDKNSCQADSGGPIQIYNTDHSYGYTIVGITSIGKPCGYADFPGVYTRVSKYVEWIESVVWPN